MYISPFLAPSLRQTGASNPQLIWDPQRLVESLLRRGADVSARSNDGESALHVVPGGYAELEVDPKWMFGAFKGVGKMFVSKMTG